MHVGFVLTDRKLMNSRNDQLKYCTSAARPPNSASKLIKGAIWTDLNVLTAFKIEETNKWIFNDKMGNSVRDGED